MAPGWGWPLNGARRSSLEMYATPVCGWMVMSSAPHESLNFLDASGKMRRDGFEFAGLAESVEDKEAGQNEYDNQYNDDCFHVL